MERLCCNTEHGISLRGSAAVRSGAGPADGPGVRHAAGRYPKANGAPGRRIAAPVVEDSENFGGGSGDLGDLGEPKPARYRRVAARMGIRMGRWSHRA